MKGLGGEWMMEVRRQGAQGTSSRTSGKSLHWKINFGSIWLHQPTLPAALQPRLKSFSNLDNPWQYPSLNPVLIPRSAILPYLPWTPLTAWLCAVPPFSEFLVRYLIGCNVQGLGKGPEGIELQKTSLILTHSKCFELSLDLIPASSPMWESVW